MTCVLERMHEALSAFEDENAQTSPFIAHKINLIMG